MWSQSNSLAHHLGTLQAWQHAIATLLDRHRIVFADIQIEAVILTTAAKCDRLEARQNVSVVVAIESQLDPWCAHFHNLTTQRH